MRHKYDTRGIVLSRSAVGEANTLVTILTEELGVVRARAQGLRRPGAKLAAALQTFAESEVVLVRGQEHWRLAGAVLTENWSARLGPAGRSTASRVNGLLLRLSGGEAHDPDIFAIVRGFLASLAAAPEDLRDAAEILAALRILRALGFDAGDMPGAPGDFSQETLAAAVTDRSGLIARVNRGIAASGL